MLCDKPVHDDRLRTAQPAEMSTVTVPAPAARSRGWLLLAAAFVTFAIGAACMHSYTVFLIAFIEAFGWSRGESSVAYSVSQLVTAAVPAGPPEYRPAETSPR